MERWKTGPRCRVVSGDNRARPAHRMVLVYASVDEFLEDCTANTRLGGTFVRTDHPLTPGSRVRLHILVAGSPKTIHTMATVDWAVHPDEGGYLAPGMGLHFDITPPG